MASNFGSIGSIIGHEISHGFDDQGSKFDAFGKLKKWWSDDVFKKYNDITRKIVDQYSKYNVEIDVDKKSKHTYFVNGNLTLGENIADLFGLSVAIDAFKAYFADNTTSFVKTVDECLLELLFAFGNTWRYIETPENAKGRITDDVHSPPQFRIIGTLHNIKDYYRIFNIPLTNDVINIFN
jgi:predicted metalloendopeptidase